MDSAVGLPDDSAVEFVVKNFNETLPVTMDEVKDGVGNSSNSGEPMSPCSRGRTLKDFEDELIELRRENFDLKMRIYLMEEQQELVEGFESIAQAQKINNSLRQEIKILQNELTEKDKLVLEAAKALELIETNYKAVVEELKNNASSYELTIAKLQQELTEARGKIESVHYRMNNSKMDDSSAMYAVAFNLPGKPGLKQPLPAASADLEALEIQCVKLERELAEEMDRRQDIEDNYERLQKELFLLQDTNSKLELEYHSQEELLKDKCREIDEHCELINSLKETVASLEKQLKMVNNDQPSAELQKRLQEFDKMEAKQLENRLEACTQENSRLQKQVEELRNQLTTYEQRIASEKHSNLEKATQQKSEDTPRLNELEEKLLITQQKLLTKEEEAKMASVEQVKAMKAIQGFVKKIKALEKDVAQMRGQIENQTRQLEAQKNVLDEHGTKLDRKGSLEGEQEIADQQVSTKGSLDPLSLEGVTEKYKAAAEELSGHLQTVMKGRNFVESVEMEKEVQVLLQCLKEKELKLMELEDAALAQKKERDNRLVALQEELFSLRARVDGRDESGFRIDSKENGQLLAELELKQNEIEHLNEELKRRTFHLQELVNKELWDKNKEIEKLNKACERKQRELDSLRQQIGIKDRELQVLQERMKLPLSDRSSLTNVQAKENEVPGLHGELKTLQEDKKRLSLEVEKLREAVSKYEGQCRSLEKELDVSDKTRKELSNACTLLITRLEELSNFLESLLPSLASKKRLMLQQAIDRSREMSRTFSFIDQSNLSIPLLPDFSQVDFCSESEVQACEDVKEAPGNEEVVRLRAQVERLVEQLRQKDSGVLSGSGPPKAGPWSEPRDDKTSYNVISLESVAEGPSLDDVSEGSLVASFDSDMSDREGEPSQLPDQKSPKLSEEKPVGAAGLSESDGCWSEPDRDVSMARIGIKEELPAPTKSTSSTTDSSGSPRKSSLSSTLRRHSRESPEIRRLNLKIRSLEHINEALKTELHLLHQLKAEHMCDKSVDCQMSSESIHPSQLLNEVRIQREKLESSLSHNDLIRKKLEQTLSLSEIIQGSSDAKEQILQQLTDMSVRLEPSTCSLCPKLKNRCFELETERNELKEKLEESEKRILSLQKEANNLISALKERENDVLEKQCSLLELQNYQLVLEGRAKAAEKSLDEVVDQRLALEAVASSAEASLKEAKEQFRHLEQEMVQLKLGFQDEKQALNNKHKLELSELRDKVSQLRHEQQKSAQESESLLDKLKKRLDHVTKSKELAESEWKIKLDNSEKENKAKLEQEMNRRMDIERKLVDSYEKQTELKSKLDTEMLRVKELEASLKLEDRAWRRRLAQLEAVHGEREADLRRKLDAATLTTSEAVLERTRLANDKLRLQHQLRKLDQSSAAKCDLEVRVAELETRNTELESRLRNALLPLCEPELPQPSKASGSISPVSLFKRQRSNPSSDYMSDQEPQTSSNSLWFPLYGRSNNNSSPDLGIESDQGRLSSMDPFPPTSPHRDLAKVEAENEQLRRHLMKTRRELEETLAQLTSANHKKRQVERAIFRQLHKTHNVLQKARVNLETDTQPSD